MGRHNMQKKIRKFMIVNLEKSNIHVYDLYDDLINDNDYIESFVESEGFDIDKVIYGAFDSELHIIVH